MISRGYEERHDALTSPHLKARITRHHVRLSEKILVLRRLEQLHQRHQQQRVRDEYLGIEDDVGEPLGVIMLRLN